MVGVLQVQVDYISGASMAANYTPTTPANVYASDGWINIEKYSAVGVVADFDSTVVGTLIFEVSNEIKASNLATTTNKATITTLTLPYVVSSVAQTSAPFQLDISFNWIRCRFVYTSGTPTATLNVKLKLSSK